MYCKTCLGLPPDLEVRFPRNRANPRMRWGLSWESVSFRNSLPYRAQGLDLRWEQKCRLGSTGDSSEQLELNSFFQCSRGMLSTVTWPMTLKKQNKNVSVDLGCYPTVQQRSEFATTLIFMRINFAHCTGSSLQFAQFLYLE